MTDLGPRLAALSQQERALLFERLRARREAPEPVRIERRPPGTVDIPLSFAQERLWFLDRLSPADPSYNVPVSVRIAGDLVPAAFSAALAAVARRHEALRTTFAEGADGPVQIVAPETAAGEGMALPEIDLRGLPDRLAEPALEREIAALSALEAFRPFDLAVGPLWRAVLLLTGRATAILLLTMHHIVSDGWSMGILVRDLGDAYRALAAGRIGRLDPLPIQYADFALWQRRTLAGEALARLVEGWRRRLAGLPAGLALPTDRPRPPVKSGAGAAVQVAFPPGAAARLSSLARASGATLFVALLAAWNALLFRHSGERAIAVGTPVANRERRETLDLIGFFVNTLVILGDLHGEVTFATLLGRLRDAAFAAFAEQELPFEKLVAELKPERDPSRTPLFQVLLTLQNAPLPPLELGDLSLELLDGEVRTAKFDLSLTAAEEGGELGATLIYSTDLFDAATAARLGRHLSALMAAAVATPGCRVAELPMLAAAEIAELVGERPVPPVSGGLLPARIAAAAARYAERPAVRAGAVILSYGELSRRAGELAARLAAAGVGPEARVALAAGRSADTVVALVAVLAAGGAYVPLDPGLPEARREALLAEAGAVALLLPGAAPGELALRPLAGPAAGAAAGRPPAPGNAAYVIFTSGSTGSPKGVVVEHRQLAHYVDGAVARLGLPAGAAYALASTFAADLGHTSLFPCLATGGCLDVLGEAEMLDPEAFAARAAAVPADCLKIVPSHLAALLTAPSPERVLPRRLLVLGGEAASPELLQRIAGLSPGLAVFNHYGPTETTVGAIAGRLLPGREGPLPLGRPLAGVSLRLLGQSGELVPAGVVGEVALGGGGVARGYLGRAAATARRFVPDPWGERGARLYLTGDLARLDPAGEPVWLGRADEQLKVRGFRVEPREIEAALEAHPAVGRAAVVPRVLLPGGAVSLVAFVQPAAEAGGGAPDPDELRAFLRRHLPAPLVPDRAAVLERLPLLANGKVDRRALAAVPLAAAPVAETELPVGETERRLAQVWSELLGRERVGRGDNFFDLGGHSLLLARLQVALRERLGVSLPLLRFFELPTVASLAAFLDGPGHAEPAPIADGRGSEGSRERASRQRQSLARQRERRQAT